MHNIKKNYFYINFTFMLLMLYALSLPCTSQYIKKYTPIKTSCTYRSLTKKNCPFCGITTDFKRIFASKTINIQKNNPISVIIFCLFCLELISRTLFMILKNKINIIIITLDIIMHFVLFICVFTWIIFFY